MKVLVNGGLNLSELDGWWAEAYTPEVGWALGDGQEHADDPTLDPREAGALYDLLEQQVIPEFYHRDPSGTPVAWVERIRTSMAQLTPRFSTNRTVREYTERHYLPAASAYRARAAERGALGRRLVEWQREVEQVWSALRFGEVRVEARADAHQFEAEVFLGSLGPDAVEVALYADGARGGEPARIVMQCVPPVAPSRPHLYRASSPAARPASDFTVRVIPRRRELAVPLECARIAWQR